MTFPDLISYLSVEDTDTPEEGGGDGGGVGALGPSVFPLITYLSSEDTDHPASEGYGAMILYDSRGMDAGGEVTTDSQATGFEALRLFDWRPTTAWKPATSGTHHVDLELAEAGSADSFAFGRYILGDSDATIVLKTSPDGATWTNCFAPVRMGDWGGRPKMVTFAEVSSFWWRVEVVSAAAPSAVAVVAFGMTYWPKYAQLVGFKPFKTARDVDRYNPTSEGGLFLGSTTLRTMTKNTLAFEHMTEAECSNEWHPFMLHCQNGIPFFVAPLLIAFPDEVALVQLDGDMPMPSYSRHRRLSVSVPMLGLVP